MSLPNNPVNMSAGTQVNRYLDALGMPDKFGDSIGAMIDLRRGDLGGALRNMVDLQSGLSTQQLDNVLGKGTDRTFGAGHVHRHRCGGNHLHRHRGTYISQEQVGKKAHIGQKYGFNWGPFHMQGRITGQQYMGSFAKPVHLPNDKYLYQGRTYDNMGAIWKDLKDGKIDGFATKRFHLPQFNNLPLLPPGLSNGLNPGLGFGMPIPPFQPSPIMNAIFGQAGGMFAGIGNILNQLPGLLGGGQPGGAQQPGASSGPGGSSGSGGAGGAGDTAFLSDPNMSLEDKLVLLMSKLSEHFDKQIQDKMADIEKQMSKEKGAQGAGGQQGGGGGLGGMLGPLGGIAGGMIGGPLGGMAGQMIGNAAGGMLGGGGAGGAGGAGGQAGQAGGQGDSNLQKLQAELQQLLDRRNQMFQTVTQMMKSLGETSMSIIRNLKA